MARSVARWIHRGGDQWPDRIDAANLKQTWRVELGPSYSGPIVAADRVFVTETEKAANEVVRALDRGTGKELWQARWKGSMRVPFFAMSNGSWIRATPAYDGESLFVAGMRDVLVSLDAESGEERWRVDFVAEFNKSLPSFGFVSSPLVVGDHVYVQAGGAARKLDKHSGKQVWASLDDGGGMYGSAFSSPMIANDRGQRTTLDPDAAEACRSRLGIGRRPLVPGHHRLPRHEHSHAGCIRRFDLHQ